MKKIFSLILIFIIFFNFGVNAEGYLLYEDFTDGYTNHWRSYGWGNRSCEIQSGSLMLGIGIGGSAASNSASPYYAQVTAGETHWENYTLEADLKLSSTNFEYSGIMVRHQNTKSYYALMFSHYSNGYMGLTFGTAYLYGDNILSGTKVPFSQIPNFDRTGFNNYRITVQDNNIKVWVNGALVIDYSDTEKLCSAGMIGFNSYATYASDSYLTVDNVKVTDNTGYKNTISFINALNGKKGFSVELQSEKENSASLYGAVYGNGKLSGVVTADLTYKGIYNNYFFETNLSGKTAKLFGWNNMMPLWNDTEAEIITERTQYYVSQSASESGDGSAEKPFNSIEQAQKAVRMTKELASSNIEIIITDDIYFLDKPLSLDSRDSLENYTVTYKGIDGKRPVISAGVKLDGFTLYDEENNIYKASAKGLDFRQLYSGKRTGIRARYPDSEKYLTISSWGENSVNLKEEIPFDDFSGVEAVIQKVWGNDVLKVAEVSGTVMTFEELSTKLEFSNHNPPKENGQVYHLENSYDFITKEGEWYLDKQNDIVYYKPFSDDDLNEIYVPKLETALIIKGENLADTVKNIRFENLTFAYTDWDYPKENPYVEIQSQQYYKGCNYKTRPESGIYVKNAENIEFENVHFSDMGSTALDFHRGVSNSKISECVFYDIAGNGISMGVFDESPNYTNSDLYNPENEADIVSNITVENCFITRAGREYYSSAGILAGNCRNVSILNNEICDLPWSGISLSWSWRTDNPTPKGFTVKYNHIYNVLNKVSDGGGIYFCGPAPESVVSDNHIHNLKYSANASGAMLVAIYLDSGTKGVTVENNSVQEASFYWENSEPENNTVVEPDGYIEEVARNAGIKSENIKQEIVYELARGKTASASSYQSDTYAPKYLTDGSVHNNARWIPSKNDTNQWAQVDLGDSYCITEVKLDSTFGANYSTEEFRRNFDILASDYEDFRESATLYSKNAENTWAEKERFSVYIKNEKTFRYIRIIKKEDTFFELSEISVYGYKN